MAASRASARSPSRSCSRHAVRPGIAHADDRRGRRRDHGPRHRPDRRRGGHRGAARATRATVPPRRRAASSRRCSSARSRRACRRRTPAPRSSGCGSRAPPTSRRATSWSRRSSRICAVKRRLFADLEQIVRDDAVLATNTSSLSVSAIAAACARPERVGGLAFLQPRAADEAGRGDPRPAHRRGRGRGARRRSARRMGHRPVRGDRFAGLPGQPRRPRLRHRGAAHPGRRASPIPVTIDRILREAAGFRMGPFELFDLVGIDVTHAVMESIWRQFYDEPRFRPQPLPRRYVDAGLLGRKTVRASIATSTGAPQMPAEPPAPTAAAPPDLDRRRRGGRSSARCDALARGASIDGRRRPVAASVCVVDAARRRRDPCGAGAATRCRGAPSRSTRCWALPAASP